MEEKDILQEFHQAVSARVQTFNRNFASRTRSERKISDKEII